MSIFRRKKSRPLEQPEQRMSMDYPVGSTAPEPPRQSRSDLDFPMPNFVPDNDIGPTIDRQTKRIASLLDAVVARIESIFESRLDKALSDLKESIESIPEPITVPAPPVEEPETEIQFNLDSIDERYASTIRRLVGLAPATAVNGQLIDLTVIGELKSGDIAWVNEEAQCFGTVGRNLLGEMTPWPDDKFRARVVSYPWGHVVLAVLPNSLSSPFATKTVADTTVSAAGTPPDSVIGTPIEHLRPGDIVLARVPFDGLGRADRHGRISKDRPCVFIKWERDFAWTRAIYDAHGYVAKNDLGIRLVDTDILEKPSVVRNAEYDIDPRNFNRVLGRLGSHDLNALNIEDSAPPTPPTIPSVAPVREDADPVNREFSRLHSEVSPSTDTGPDEMMTGMLRAMALNDVTRTILRNDGVHYAKVGHVFTNLFKAVGTLPPRGAFRDLIASNIESRIVHDGMVFERRLDDNNHPVLWLVPVGTSAPRTQEVTFEPIPRDDVDAPTSDQFAQLVLDEEYVAPDLIIFDQEAVAQIMEDRRLDLETSLRLLRADGDAEGHIIGSDAQLGWAAFQKAARARGWKTVPAHTREEVITAAVSLANSCGAMDVTVVGYFADLVAELENSGFEVTVVQEVD